MSNYKLLTNIYCVTEEEDRMEVCHLSNGLLNLDMVNSDDSSSCIELNVARAKTLVEALNEYISQEEN